MENPFISNARSRGSSTRIQPYRSAPPKVEQPKPKPETKPHENNPSLFGIMAQGFAFGGGSAVAHRAVDGILGPREAKVIHVNDQPTCASPVENRKNDCRKFQEELSKCLSDNTKEIAVCQSYVDKLYSCQNGEMMTI